MAIASHLEFFVILGTPLTVSRRGWVDVWWGGGGG